MLTSLVLIGQNQLMNDEEEQTLKSLKRPGWHQVITKKRGPVEKGGRGEEEVNKERRDGAG